MATVRVSLTLKFGTVRHRQPVTAAHFVDAQEFSRSFNHWTWSEDRLRREGPAIEYEYVLSKNESSKVSDQ